jgi:ribosomal protein S18 acetylase RimI-like enzyme
MGFPLLDPAPCGGRSPPETGARVHDACVPPVPRTISVRRAKSEDEQSVIAVLARAFDADPVANYLLRQDAGRARGFELCFGAFFRHMCLPHHEVWVAEGALGTALWTPPGCWEVSLRRAVSMGPALVRAVGITRIVSAARAAGRAQDHHPREPHFYLFALGVDPAHQGRGVGSALLGAGLARCDEQGAAAYLEASTPESARLYERHGFRSKGELLIAPDAPPIWPMWRDPVMRHDDDPA